MSEDAETQKTLTHLEDEENGDCSKWTSEGQ